MAPSASKLVPHTRPVKVKVRWRESLELAALLFGSMIPMRCTSGTRNTSGSHTLADVLPSTKKISERPLPLHSFRDLRTTFPSGNRQCLTFRWMILTAFSIGSSRPASASILNATTPHTADLGGLPIPPATGLNSGNPRNEYQSNCYACLSGSYAIFTPQTRSSCLSTLAPKWPDQTLLGCTLNDNRELNPATHPPPVRGLLHKVWGFRICSGQFVPSLLPRCLSSQPSALWLHL
jgi:hypothetical protein